MWYLTVQSDSAGTNETGTAGRLGGYYLRRGNLLSSWCNPTIPHPTLDILLVLVSTSARLSHSWLIITHLSFAASNWINR